MLLAFCSQSSRDLSVVDRYLVFYPGKLQQEYFSGKLRTSYNRPDATWRPTEEFFLSTASLLEPGPIKAAIRAQFAREYNSEYLKRYGEYMNSPLFEKMMSYQIRFFNQAMKTGYKPLEIPPDILRDCTEMAQNLRLHELQILDIKESDPKLHARRIKRALNIPADHTEDKAIEYLKQKSRDSLAEIEKAISKGLLTPVFRDETCGPLVPATPSERAEILRYSKEKWLQYFYWQIGRGQSIGGQQKALAAANR